MYTALEHTKTQLFTSLTVKLIIKADERTTIRFIAFVHHISSTDRLFIETASF